MNKFKLFVVSILALVALALPAMAIVEEKTPFIPYKDEAKTPYTKAEITGILQDNQDTAEALAVVISDPKVYGGKYPDLRAEGVLRLSRTCEPRRASEFPDGRVTGYNTFLLVEVSTGELVSLMRTENRKTWTGDDLFCVDLTTGIPLWLMNCGNPPITEDRFEGPDVSLGEVPLTFERKPVAPAPPPMARAPETIREHEQVVSPAGDTSAEATATAEGGSVNIYPDRFGRLADDDCFGLSPQECAKHKEKMAQVEADREVRVAREQAREVKAANQPGIGMFAYGLLGPGATVAPVLAGTRDSGNTLVTGNDNDRTLVLDRSRGDVTRVHAPSTVFAPSTSDNDTSVFAPTNIRERTLIWNPVTNTLGTSCPSGVGCIPVQCRPSCQFPSCPPVCVPSGGPVLGNPGTSSGGTFNLGNPGGTFGGGGGRTFGNSGGTFGNQPGSLGWSTGGSWPSGGGWPGQ